MSDYSIQRGVYNIIGAHPTTDRADLDYYSTDPTAIDKLLSAYQLPHNVWECASGGGNLTNRLVKFGHNVYSSDIVDRGCGDVKDFFLFNKMPDGFNCIVTNPPYSQATEFIIHAIKLVEPTDGVVCMFLKTQFIESLKRYKAIFREHNPEYMLQFIQRISCYKNNDTSKENNAMPFCWLIWDNAERNRRKANNESTATQIKWI